MAGLDKRVIAEVLGWEEDHVEKIIRRYVDRMAATKAVLPDLPDRRLRPGGDRTQKRRRQARPRPAGSPARR